MIATNTALPGTEELGIFQCARVDPNHPIEETIGILKGFVEEGLFDYIGLSECSAATIRKAHAVHPVLAVEIELSSWSMEETRNVRVPKGSFVHVPVEAFNLDKEIWGPSAWEFKCARVLIFASKYLVKLNAFSSPDRWDSLPEAVSSQPGLYSNILTFSAGPRVSALYHFF